MKRYGQNIPLRLDDRVEAESEVLSAYNSTIKGRRIDFVRNLVIVGYQTLYGKTPPALLFAPETPGEKEAPKPREKASKPRAEAIVSKEVVVETPTISSTPGFKLTGMLGNQQ